MSHSSLNSRLPVAIVGGGPVGLSLALGLARHRVRSLLLERKERTSERSKAPGLHVRTREIFRQWGIEERFLEEGELLRTLSMHSVIPGRRPLLSMDFSELDKEADNPGLLLLEQGHTERLLLQAVQESGMCEVHFGTEAIGLTQREDSAAVMARNAQGEHLFEADYVIGCDGASSFVRAALGLPFDGITYSLQPLLADVKVEDGRNDLPWPRAWTGAGGYAFAARLPGGLWRLVELERTEPTKGDEVPDERVHEVVAKVLGPGPVEVVWSSLFRIHVRSSPKFRVGRVLLAGDAAHVHSPASGFGMNGGVQDAHNLAWKLAYALRGGDAKRLLDSYEVERKAVVVENVSRYTDVITRVFLGSPPAVREAAFFLLRSLFRSARMRKISLRRTTMIDLDYPASPLLDEQERAAGVRLPNPVLHSPDGADVRLYDLLPNRPVLLEVTENPAAHADLPVEDVIHIGSGGYHDSSGLLRGLLGKDGWILVRPDAHVAWARERLEGSEGALQRALGVMM